MCDFIEFASLVILKTPAGEKTDCFLFLMCAKYITWRTGERYGDRVTSYQIILYQTFWILKF